MSGEEKPRLLARKRRQNKIFISFLYLLFVLTLFATLALFLSNVDQLFPRDFERIPSMNNWRGEKTKEPLPSFAGEFWNSGTYWRSIKLTFITATLTMLISALLGIPAAYALSRYSIPGSQAVEILFSSLIVLPSSSVGLCLVILFQFSPLYDLQQWLSITVVYSLSGIIIAQLILSLAMGMSAWKASFDMVNPRLEHVARSLGSSSWRTFWTVSLPCAKDGLIAGLILAWTRAAAEFGGVLIFCSTFSERPLEYFSPLSRFLGIHKADPLAVSMWSQIEYGNVELGFAMGFTLVAISLVSVYTINQLGGKGYVR